MVTVSKDQLEEFIELMALSGTEFSNIGDTGGDSLIIDDENYGSIDDFNQIYINAIADKMNS